MKLKKTKLTILTLILSLGLIGCDSKEPTNPSNPDDDPVVEPGDGDNPSGPGEPAEGLMRVYFKAPSTWKRAYIWAWTDGVGNHTADAWPGASMEKDETKGLFYFDYDTTMYKNCIFSNGTKQTEDLKSPTSLDADCYVWRVGWFNEDTTVEPNTVEFAYWLIGSFSSWQKDGAIGMTLSEEVTSAYASYVGTVDLTVGAAFKIVDDKMSQWIGYGSNVSGSGLSSFGTDVDGNFVTKTAGRYTVKLNISTRAETYITIDKAA